MALKYVFLILSIIVIFFIFYKQYNFGQRWKEQMSGLGSCGSSSNDQSYTPPPCNNKYKSASDLPLREYCVKSCFNSAYNDTTKTVTSDELTKRITEGYRFFDFNVSFVGDPKNDVIVGFSQDNAPTMTEGTLLLSEALKTISGKAFSSSTIFSAGMSNAYSFPAFVHIRVYSGRNETGELKTDIISKVAKIIVGTKNSPPAYSIHFLRDSTGAPTQIDGCTNLSSIMGKLVISMDILNVLEIYAPVNYQFASTIPPETIAAMHTFVNILSGGSTFPAFYRYTEDSLIHRTNTLGLSDSSIVGSLKTNTKNMYISFPHPDDVSKGTGSPPNATGVIQPNIERFILGRSIQFIPMRVYLGNDASGNLTKYEAMFSHVGTPFAPMTYVYKYLNSTTA